MRQDRINSASGLDIAAYVDEVVSTDFNMRGVSRQLYLAACEKLGGHLCLKAAERLERSKSVLLATGFKILRFNASLETDGPLSTTLLTMCLEKQADVNCVVATDEEGVRVIEKALKAVGVKQAKVYGLPTSFEKSAAMFEKLVEENRPDVAVAVERPSANNLGVYHNALGEDVSRLHAPLDRLLEGLRRRGVQMIAYGDGGNEVGMGLVKEAVMRHVEYGAVCRCGCGGGIASDTEADILVVSSISDLGVFGTLSLMKTPMMEAVVETIDTAMKTLTEAGCVDARKGPGYLGVDGFSLDGIKSVLHLLQAAIRSDARPP
ncbi:MAG: DUF4392 domain-containing protein [Candidatus Caldarchaeum sp.]|nr:DUF4392 domain-containing protein [Candidatus Caldarchaeum sp.]